MEIESETQDHGSSCGMAVAIKRLGLGSAGEKKRHSQSGRRSKANSPEAKREELVFPDAATRVSNSLQIKKVKLNRMGTGEENRAVEEPPTSN